MFCFWVLLDLFGFVVFVIFCDVGLGWGCLDFVVEVLWFVLFCWLRCFCFGLVLGLFWWWGFVIVFGCVGGFDFVLVLF